MAGLLLRLQRAGHRPLPPFTLADVPDYPARLDIAYPEHLSRGLVLVKSWLLAIPHYLVVAFFVGGTVTVTMANGEHGPRQRRRARGPAGVLRRHRAAGPRDLPRGIFDAVLGMDRWVIRVAAYAALGLEVIVLALILRYAWTWPRRTASPATLAASLDSEPLRTPQQA